MASSEVRRAVFLDRDGVLNAAVVREGRPYPPATAGEMRLLPGVERACASLKSRGFLLIVVTNQPDIARGATTSDAVDAINATLSGRLPLDDIYVCPHDGVENCDCRKPKPGLLLRAAGKWNIDLSASFMVGDRWRDVEAGAAAGCRTVFIDYGYDERQPEKPDFVVNSLTAAVPLLLGEERKDIP